MKLMILTAVLAGLFSHAAAGEFADLQRLRAAGVPAAAVPAPAQEPAYSGDLAPAYGEYYSALKAYSEIAFVSPQDSPQYLEAAAAGQYLRARLEALGGGPGEEAAARLPGAVSFRVASELEDVFGYGGRGAAARGVPIKAGYCQINYVKNSVPFLVQHDGFLNKGEVILTFDDGPGPLTEEVSAAMRAGKAPSLFFVLGASLGASGKARIKKETEDGHFVGVHGYYHATQSSKPFTALSTGEILKQLGGVKNSITAAAGRQPGFFRPPYGVITPEAVKAIASGLGLVPVGWTIDTLDWSTKDPDLLFKKTVAMIQQRGKGIVLMHDIHPQSRTAALRLVKWLGANGYKAVSPERLTAAYEGK